MRKESKKIAHEEIVRALKKFQKRGGLITRLADEATPRRDRVGAEYGVYEHLFEVSGFRVE